MSNERAIELLGSGLTPVQAASVLGISESRISQLMGDEDFAQKVTARRIEQTTKFIARDGKYDALEDTLLQKLEDLLPYMHDPMKILRSIQILNGAKRRGTMSPTEVIAPSSVVPLTIPVTLAVQFVTNVNGEVLEVGGRSLAPMSSGGVMAKLKEKISDGSRAIPQEVLSQRTG